MSNFITPAAAPTSSSPAQALSQENYVFLQQYIRDETGISLGDDKRYLVESRLTPLLAGEHLASLDALCSRLRANPGDNLRRRVAESMTTHETLFFRDPQVFDALRNHVLPKLAATRQATRSIRIWSAACSSGQEAYSIAMMLLEMGMGNWTIDIVGTDLSQQILDRARAGRYYQIEMNRGLPATLLIKYFQRAGTEWELKENVRRMCRFSMFDLRQDMRQLGSFDLVCCRNVLIYFDITTRRRILNGIRNQLFQGGYLLLGSSETTYNIDSTFRRTQFGNAIFYQNPEHAK